MSENVISFDNTPLFDQLSKEYAARGRAYESLIAGGVTQLRPVGIQGIRAPYAAVDELPEVMEKLQTDEAVDAAANHAAPVVKTLREHFEKDAVIEQFTIDPEAVAPKPLDTSYIEMMEATQEATQNIFGFLTAQMDQFQQEHPYAVIDDVKIEREEDGSAKFVIEAREPSIGGVPFSEAIAGAIQNGDQMMFLGKSVMDYYDEPDTKKTQPIPVSSEYLKDREAVTEGIMSVNTYRRKYLESNDPEPIVGRP